MKIPEEILKKYDSLKAGQVYYGDCFAKNKKDHAAIVVSIFNGTVNFFCFTSQSGTIEHFRKIDPSACIKLQKSEAAAIFENSEKNTYLYCGMKNWGKMTESEFLRKLSNGEIRLRDALPDELFSKIKEKVKNSETFSPALLKEMGF